MFKIVRWTMRSVGRLVAYSLFLPVVVATTAVVLGWSPAVVQTTRLYDVHDLLAVDEVFAFAEPATAPLTDGDGPEFVGELVRAPHTLGDDANLDELWLQCEAGYGRACDDLFDRSPLGSAYEEYGLTCGGRGEIFDCQAELDGVLDPYVIDGWPPPVPGP
ncbi:MAG: hypothetical protein AAGE88_03010 [Actinomycetota bacterium]